MKHDDEVAKVSAIKLAKRIEHARDIDALIVKYEGALARLKRREREVESLRRGLAASEAARIEQRAASVALTIEVANLKKSLIALRGSRSYRLGRAISRPWQLVEPVRRSLTGMKSSAKLPSVKAAPQLAASHLSGDSSEKKQLLRKAAPVIPDAGHDSTTVESHYNWLLNQFLDSPSRGSAIKVIYFDYFTCGSLKRPADFIQEHANLLAEVTPKELKVLGNIQGQAALLVEAPALPPRQSNIGYLAERGRIMYCAHSSGHFNSNGYSTRTTGLVGGLQTAGEDVVVVARPGYPWDSKVDISARETQRFEQQINGVPHVFNPGPSWTSDRLDQYLAEATDIFVREAQRNRVSLMHSASNYVTALPALIAARRMGVPFVYEVRGLWEITELSTKSWWDKSDRFKLAKKLESLVATNADRVLAITGQVRAELINRGVDPAKISLLPNAVDTNAFAPMPASRRLRAKLGIDDKTTIVGYAGSLVAYEGVADLVSAVGSLRTDGRDIALVVVGDGPEFKALKEQSNALGLSDCVTFTGRIPSTEVAAYISVFDIMPCPRRKLQVTEMVSPLKPLEAMACGKAMILSDLAPMRELAGSHGERALLAVPGDVESLSSAITALMDDDALSRSMARRARLWTIRERTWIQAGAVAVAAHRAAREDYRLLQPGVPLGGLTIAIISDQFTMEGLKPEVNLVVLRPDSWREQLVSQPVDALFVESAWEGINGLWRQKIGFYDDEKFDDLKQILAACNKMAVPTIFWNKEDPVHFNRFRKTSKYFDHIFTSDATCIKSYMDNAGIRQKTVSSLSFYAQPKLHNILPSMRQYEHTVNYAGSYYGERFAERSAELAKLLTAASDYGLSIYDRQHLNPDSPYRFPEELSRYVHGGLDYSEMVEAYKAHPVHINVNSVADSPTMFSRRVMEIAASGGAIVSGKGRGVEEIFAGLVPVVSSKGDAGLLIRQWLGDEETRLRDTWLSYRMVHRMHTAAHRLAYALRTAGLQVQSPEPEKYGVFVESVTAQVLAQLAKQTVLPTQVFCLTDQGSVTTDIPITTVESYPDAVVGARSLGLNWLGTLGTEALDRTSFEDLLTALSFGTWGVVSSTSDGLDTPGLGMAHEGTPDPRHAKMSAITQRATRSLVLRKPVGDSPVAPSASAPYHPEKTLRVLVAGHDLKFAGGIIRKLKSDGHKVTIDEWTGHSGHDEELSRSRLYDADVIFCEWTLGNAVWYSKNKSPNQRLVSRLHLQELSTAYLDRIDFNSVDSVIFVGQHTADVAIRDHGIPAEKTTVIPNYVDVASLSKNKAANARFNLGLVGIIPERKRFDIALDILTSLRSKDDRFQLFIKGKRPQDYSWMADRPDEMKFYEEQFSRIKSDPLLKDAVHFDGHGDDMPEWYSKIGIALSLSDFESFHLTLADGAASGSVPLSLAWPGADQIYPEKWLSADAPSLAQEILEVTRTQENWLERSQEAREFSSRNFDEALVLDRILGEIIGF
ncbi:glycosyltransferase [Specibacter sp. NPDC078709]|uniref:glycosyltransferase n=1 Tax=Specibacter sp. NPDC078709 TaxID=3154364 RepID=UPI00342D9445